MAAETEGQPMQVRYSPLEQQFADVDEIFDELRALVRSTDFTLGKVVGEFEEMFAAAAGSKYAIGVGSGTDALKIPLKALGIGPGDEVITAANTFYATAGAIAETGSRIVFVDCDDTFGIDPDLIEAAITPRTKAIMPVHLAGDMANMTRITAIAEEHGLSVVEDACQSLLATEAGRPAGTWGIAGGFSMHPLKIINVWGDAGVIVTDDPEMDRMCRLLRNHGLRNRDEMEILGYNTRLDSVQAVVGKWIVARVEDIVAGRIEAAEHYDAAFADVPEITLPVRRATKGPEERAVYLNYVVYAERRDELLAHCHAHKVDAKVHYPIPLYKQDALRHLGYPDGAFPVTDRHAQTIISFPADQHLSTAELDYLIGVVRGFYGR
ncbi:DegT/DnrJ/EryC1/StrS family aminotransferase [Nisaea denitrificans]|uniref:DegT/DnrJ/EryC1/StrS family aminotransferase n=1 Tax=Nisaea denitrificans TaxID=390877 RepID=UPI00041D8ACD|nr:DegT/DnrJ/EryC1/StrS family aminotransferase [Nisaea denitrificans]